jgi:hypothetical protein
VELHRLVERLRAVATRAAAAFDAGREWESAGARSSAAWVALRCGVPVAEARRRVQLGRELRGMPETEAAWVAGEIGEAHAEPLAALRRRAGSELFARDEAELAGCARELPFRGFRRAVAYWRQGADPDGAEEDAAAQRAGRRLHLSQSFEGMWLADAVLDPIGGEIVSGALERIETELLAADWAAAKAEHGEAVCAADVARTPTQRRADALVEMARRAGAVPAGGRLPAPLVTVLVGYETFAGRMCELASGTVVTPGSVLPWLTEAHLERVVCDGPERVKNVGVRRRLYSGATRRAVEVRDRECFSEFCDVPAEDCDIDHVEAYRAGGLTTDDNGRPACAYHNRLRHKPP